MDKLIDLTEQQVLLMERRLEQLGITVPEPEPLAPLAVGDLFELQGKDFVLEELRGGSAVLRQVSYGGHRQYRSPAQS